MPVDMGSTTFRAAAAATAPSTALPPHISICRPAIAASGWLVATIPRVAITGERRELKRKGYGLPGLPGEADSCSANSSYACASRIRLNSLYVVFFCTSRAFLPALAVGMAKQL